MADKSMKAVIRAEVDPRGVVSGVAATNKALQTLNKTAASASTSAAISAGINMAQMGMSALQQVFAAVERRFGELNNIANKYSAAAAGARMAADVSIIQDNVRIAQALAPGAIQASQAEADIKAGEAARMERNAAGMNAGMGATARFRGNIDVGVGILTEAVMQGIAGAEQLTRGDVGGFGAFLGAAPTAANELLTASNYAYKNEAPGRGMAGSEMAEQTQLLRDIRDSLKGSR